MSVEIDILPIADGNAETERLADLIEGVAGEFSPFEELHGFSINSVDLARLPCQEAGAQARQGPERQYRGTGRRAPVCRLCLDKEDLCVAKLCAFREKDQNFVAALVRSALVDRRPSSPGWPPLTNATAQRPKWPHMVRSLETGN